MLKKRSTLTSYIVIVFLSILILVLIRVFVPKHHVPQRAIASMSNLKQIALSLLVYAQDHNDILPENIEQLEEYDKMPYIFNSPLKPRDFNGPSYIYVNGHTLTKDEKLSPKYIFVYENPEYRAEYMDDKINVAYLNGYVERLERERFISKLRATYDHLGREMPEIRFKN